MSIVYIAIIHAFLDDILRQNWSAARPWLKIYSNEPSSEVLECNEIFQ